MYFSPTGLRQTRRGVQLYPAGREHSDRDYFGDSDQKNLHKLESLQTVPQMNGDFEQCIPAKTSFVLILITKTLSIIVRN